MSRDYVEYAVGAVRKREEELDALRGKYQLAKARVSGCNYGPDLVELYRLLRSYRPGEAPEKAVYILAQITTLFGKLVEPHLLIADYEDRERVVNEMREQLSRPEPMGAKN